jgi:NhaP-type Na+/H+ or K+/H+ antiporter
MATFAALLAVVLIWGLVSGRLARYSVTLPIVLVVVGAVLSAIHVVAVQLDSESVRILVELALSILLFADATEISARWLRSAGRLPLRMLALGFPVTIAAGFAAGYLLFPGTGVWVVALLAAALAATDAALASPVIMDERLPVQLRRIIDVESASTTVWRLRSCCSSWPELWPAAARSGARRRWSTRWSSSPSASPWAWRSEPLELGCWCPRGG